MTDQLPDSESGHFKYGTHRRETGADERSALAGGQTEQADSPHRPISPGPSSEIRLDEQLGRLPGQKKGPDAPATRYRFTDGTVEVGLISTVTEPLSLRLTAPTRALRRAHQRSRLVSRPVPRGERSPSMVVRRAHPARRHAPRPRLRRERRRGAPAPGTSRMDVRRHPPATPDRGRLGRSPHLQSSMCWPAAMASR